MTGSLDEIEFIEGFSQEEDGSSSHAGHPEYKLMAAVLERSILDLALHSEFRQEVKDWLNEKQVDDPYIYSFQYICESLNLDVDLMRSKIITRAKGLQAEKAARSSGSTL